jgi:hypothetical protein
VSTEGRRRPSEVTEVHTRLLRCSLELEPSRAYWRHAGQGEAITAERAFEGYWFGARSLARARVLMANMRARFDAYPSGLEVLRRWPDIDLDTRRAIGHWHLQLSDPLYRAFTGDFLVVRHQQQQARVRRDGVIHWVDQQGPGRWSMATRIQFASKVLTAAHAAGLVVGIRDPRPLSFPAVTDQALTYVLYLLREVDFEGTLLHNPYLASVGLSGSALEGRLRGLAALSFARQGSVYELAWSHSSLTEWAAAALASSPMAAASDMHAGVSS